MRPKFVDREPVPFKLVFFLWSLVSAGNWHINDDKSERRGSCLCGTHCRNRMMVCSWVFTEGRSVRWNICAGTLFFGKEIMCQHRCFTVTLFLSPLQSQNHSQSGSGVHWQTEMKQRLNIWHTICNHAILSSLSSRVVTYSGWFAVHTWYAGPLPLWQRAYDSSGRYPRPGNSDVISLCSPFDHLTSLPPLLPSLNTLSYIYGHIWMSHGTCMNKSCHISW